MCITEVLRQCTPFKHRAALAHKIFEASVKLFLELPESRQNLRLTIKNQIFRFLDNI